MTLVATIPITGTLDDVIYQTYRKVLTDTLMMQYAIPVPAADIYQVRLHFAEPYWGVPGRFTSSDCTPAACPNRRKFDVVLEGVTVLDNYDLNAETPPATVIVKTYRVPVSDGTLDLFFDSRASSGGVDRAIVSGIEVMRVGATPDTTAPTAPGNLRVVGETANSIVLAWDAASDASGTVIYEVYRKKELVATTTSTSALIQANPRAGLNLSVRARDAAGNVSAPSNFSNRLYLPLVMQNFQPPRLGPTNAATARYVRYNWDDDIDIDLDNDGTNERVSRAYARGYFAAQGSPQNTVILDFGRQVDPDRADEVVGVEAWGVQLPLDNRDFVDPVFDRIKDRAWVIQVAESFIGGYLDNPAHSGDVRIAIATHNANYDWTCTGENTSELWEQAGIEWRDMLDQIQVFRNQRVTVELASGNDIEAWRETFDNNWIACGAGTVEWLEGFTFGHPDKVVLATINFGSNAYDEASQEWSLDQIYAVTNGLGDVEIHPQIYCPDQIDGWIKLADELTLEEEPKILRFSGVTSENAGSNTCGGRSYEWRAAWSAFDEAIRNSALDSTLQRSVSSFNYGIRRDSDMP
jgi:hypothetical protein